MVFAALVENLSGDDGLIDLYRRSDGMCFPHLSATLSRMRKPDGTEALLEAQDTIWARLEQELDELIRKTDYRFQDESIGVEGTSWMRAIAIIAGEKPDDRT